MVNCHQRLYADKRKKGICVTTGCYAAAEADRVRCSHHLAYYRGRDTINNPKSVARFRQQGLCVRCGNPKVEDCDEGYNTCINCRTHIGEGVRGYGIIDG